jgi:hypothetical protein
MEPISVSKAFIGSPGTITPQISLVDLRLTKIIAQFNVCYLISAEYTLKIMEISQGPTEPISLFQSFH